MVKAVPQLRRSGLALVGRREELGALEDELSRAVAGEFRLVLLLGEAGVGKSRLGRELLTRHDEVTGLVAQAYPLAASAALVFGPRLWIRSFARAQTAMWSSSAAGCSTISRASFIASRSCGARCRRDPPLPRLLQGLAGLLGNASRRTPLVVLLDDVHFADASSWQALRHFARHLDDARLLVVATSRPAELAGNDIAAQALFELDQDGLLSRLEVAAMRPPRSGSWPRR